SLAEAPVEDVPEDDGVEDLLADMADEVFEEEEPDDSGEILSEMANTLEEVEPGDDAASDILADLAEAPVEDVPEDDGLDDLLADIAEDTPEEDADDNDLEDMLGEIAETAVEEDIVEDATSDILADMADIATENEDGGAAESSILESLAAEVLEDEPVAEGTEDLLSEMAEDQPEEDSGDADLDDLLGSMSDDHGEEIDDVDDDLDDLLAGMADDTADEEDADDGLDDLLADMAVDEPEDDSGDLDLDALLADVSQSAPEGDDEQDDDLDSLLGLGEDEDDADGSDDLDLDALLADVDGEEEETDDLEALLSGADDDDDDEADLDALLAGMDDDEDDDLDSLLADGSDDDDLDALLADDDDDIDLDDLLADDDSRDDLLADSGLDDLEIDDVDDTPAAPPPKPKKPAFKPDFGSMSAAKLQYEAGARRKFRIAVLGDFSGRGNRGDLEIGEALGKRKAFKLDFDTMEDVIMRFRTTLTLPLGNDGSAVEVELNELDDLHPDELFENVELFNELNMLRRDLNSGRNFEQNVERMKAWGGEFGDFKALSKKRSKGADAPADLRLTDFQNLIGDEVERPEASAASDLISRIIGPHIVAAADNGAEAMVAAVDAALSTAMSSVLHHPDFQTIEAAWRSIELLGRRVEASAELEVVVYDVSVEEFAADLAAQDDVSQSGLFDMLAEKPMQDENAGPISAVVGLYTWEETPTHAELLARMARISAHMDAPFISAISTGFMGVKPEDRHPLVQKTWNALGEMPEAKYLGLASPRFMLRMPYGKKTEPLDRFDYEEFNVKEGMRSMLMANPALLVAVLLAETKARQGGDMSLGSIMSLNDMPFHFMTDQYGDQVALPCTERLLSVSGAADVVARGFMPVISVQGQNIVKLGSFQAVGGGELLGIWSGDAAKEMKSGKARMETSVGISSSAKQTGAPPKATAKADGGGDDAAYGFDSDLGDDNDDDDLDLDLDFGDDDDFDLDLDLGDDDDGMDDLLAGFGDDDDDDDDDEMDADLAALLGDL
ncbi:MAG TPA: type VI secretion system contractile sheath small subunit, partial [Rhodobacteraceae bacterium]|nr:type VI secretion system contractile sheath small subunit [Paracoccaceae bacterium]